MLKPKSKVLVIGSGPIIIGQAAEFDYSGTQACKAIREEGHSAVLVNSNPASIMTDTDIADSVYLEPLTIDFLEMIIEKEQPDGVIGTLGGQTGLNLLVELSEAGILKKYGVKPLGTDVKAVQLAENREKFRDLLKSIKEPVPPSEIVTNVDDALHIGRMYSFPLIIRPAYTLGGTGGGIAYDEGELRKYATSGIAASPLGQILIELSLISWKEIEFEVLRDASGNSITVCHMENIDPMGVHTGDSIVVAPCQTLTDIEINKLRTAALKIVEKIGVEGGCNIQFAYKPSALVYESIPPNSALTSDYYVIEVNPRVSRSSALASKATGYPIARVATKIALGLNLNEIQNSITKNTSAAFEPALDYVAVKIPRWPFDKFPTADHQLNTQMKSTGEVLALERTFEAALNKAIRSLEDGKKASTRNPNLVESELKGKIPPEDKRIWKIFKLLHNDYSVAEVTKKTLIDPWFIQCMKNIVDLEALLLEQPLNYENLMQAKRFGFSDEQIAKLVDFLPQKVKKLRLEWGIIPSYRMVDTCAGEFESATPYYYSTYGEENEAKALPNSKGKAIVLGSGPIQIGQGIEFDYSCCHAVFGLRKMGIKSIMINSNPETLSTDFDISDRLYLEPLDIESVVNVLENEQVNDKGEHDSTKYVIQFGGQTAINLTKSIDELSYKILGSPPKAIANASDRGLFEEVLTELVIPHPPGAAVTTLEQAKQVANAVGYPVLVRPSYVLGGRGMEIVNSDSEIAYYFNEAAGAMPNQNVLVDKYVQGIEIEVDAVIDSENVVIPGILEHVERAGVHSGDSMCIYPTQSLNDEEIETVVSYTKQIGKKLKLIGLMNIQYIVSKTKEKSTIYVLEVNPRASRTMPFLSKVTNFPIAQLGMAIMAGRKLSEFGYESGLLPIRKNLVAVKAPVFSMSKLSNVDTYLGPEMKSTGEVIGLDTTYREAVAKALIAANMVIAKDAPVLISLANKDKEYGRKVITILAENKHPLFATPGTAKLIRQMGYIVTEVGKMYDEVKANVITIISQGLVGAVINTITGEKQIVFDGFHIRRASVERRIPCFTSLDTALLAAITLNQNSKLNYTIKSLQHYNNL